MNKKVFKIKDKHFKKVFSYGKFYRKIGLIKYFNSHPEHNFKIQEVLASQKTSNYIHRKLTEFYHKYMVLFYDNNKIIKKEEPGVTKQDVKNLAMDALNYSPKIDNEVPENEIWVVWK